MTQQPDQVLPSTGDKSDRFCIFNGSYWEYIATSRLTLTPLPTRPDLKYYRLIQKSGIMDIYSSNPANIIDTGERDDYLIVDSLGNLSIITRKEAQLNYGLP